MASPLQFAYRTQKTISIFDASPVYEAVQGFNKPEGNLRCIKYSDCGRYFAYATSEGVYIADASVGHILTTLKLSLVFDLGFSPLGTYICTWERPGKDEAGDATKNLKIWRTIEGVPEGEKQPVGQFVQKSQTGWNLQYTSDELFCARTVTNEVQFYESHDLKNVWNKLRVEGVTTFALAPGKSHNIAVFVPERKGQPAAVKVFNVPQFNAPISQKTFFKGDKVQLKWNQEGSSLIVLAQTEVDKSNRSYYGETTLYLLSANGSFDARITLDKEGPIHDVSWSPNSKEFGVVYGYMPAKTTIFNQRAIAMHNFASGPRNSIIFSPTGRFVLVAGFGNLAGQIDVYDLEKDFRKVTTIESGNPSVCEWSSDSRYIMTATTSPRLRVDNGVKLWHVGGGIMYNEDMVELYSIAWRPSLPQNLPKNIDPLHPVPTPHASALAYLGTVKTPSKPAGAYRPPGARGTSTPLHFKREDEGGAAHVVSNGVPNVGANGFGRPRRQIPGAELADGSVPGAAPARPAVPGSEAMGGSDENLSKAALKNKKKRNNKKTKEGEAGVEGGSVGGGVPLDPAAQPYVHEPRGQDRHTPSQSRSASRNPGRGNNRNRSDTQRNGHGGREQTPSGRGGPSYQQQQQQPQPPQQQPPQAAAPPAASPAAAPESDNAANGPQAKKLRSLQKKIRAIEDLEMRHAGGEKLEDTQLKKIATKAQVMAELEALE